jgi:hypothetical protein
MMQVMHHNGHHHNGTNDDGHHNDERSSREAITVLPLGLSISHELLRASVTYNNAYLLYQQRFGSNGINMIDTVSSSIPTPSSAGLLLEQLYHRRFSNDSSIHDGGDQLLGSSSVQASIAPSLPVVIATSRDKLGDDKEFAPPNDASTNSRVVPSSHVPTTRMIPSPKRNPLRRRKKAAAIPTIDVSGSQPTLVIDHENEPGNTSNNTTNDNPTTTSLANSSDDDKRYTRSQARQIARPVASPIPQTARRTPPSSPSPSSSSSSSSSSSIANGTTIIMSGAGGTSAALSSMMTKATKVDHQKKVATTMSTVGNGLSTKQIASSDAPANRTCDFCHRPSHYQLIYHSNTDTKTKSSVNGNKDNGIDDEPLSYDDRQLVGPYHTTPAKSKPKRIIPSSLSSTTTNGPHLVVPLTALTSEIWVHYTCALWAPKVFQKNNNLENVVDEFKRGTRLVLNPPLLFQHESSCYIWSYNVMLL